MINIRKGERKTVILEMNPESFCPTFGVLLCNERWKKKEDWTLSVPKVWKTNMTEAYDPYANAVAERVNGILKSPS